MKNLPRLRIKVPTGSQRKKRRENNRPRSLRKPSEVGNLGRFVDAKKPGPKGPGFGAADGTRTDQLERNDKESLGTVGAVDPQKRPEIPSEGTTGTQSVTPVTESEPMTPLQRDALMRAIRSAREDGRHLDANALGEIFARLGG